MTGSTVGIGGAILERLPPDDIKVLVADLDVDKAAETARWNREGGGTADALRIDGSSLDSIRAAFEQVDRYHGRCDILVKRRDRQNLLISRVSARPL